MKKKTPNLTRQVRGSRKTNADRLNSLLTVSLLVIGIAVVVRVLTRRSEHPLHLPSPPSIHLPSPLVEAVNEPLSSDGPTLFAAPDAIDPLDDDAETLAGADDAVAPASEFERTTGPG